MDAIHGATVVHRPTPTRSGSPTAPTPASSSPASAAVRGKDPWTWGSPRPPRRSPSGRPSTTPRRRCGTSSFGPRARRSSPARRRTRSPSAFAAWCRPTDGEFGQQLDQQPHLPRQVRRRPRLRHPRGRGLRDNRPVTARSCMDLVRVRFRDCRCPGTPHDGADGRDDGDYADLRPHLNFQAGAEAYSAFAQLGDGKTSPTQLAEYLGPVYLRRGVVDWNLLDGDGGSPVPFSNPRQWRSCRTKRRSISVDRADDLYTKGVVRPFGERRIASSSQDWADERTVVRPRQPQDRHRRLVARGPHDPRTNGSPATPA